MKFQSYDLVIPSLHPAFLLRSSEGEAGGAGAFFETFVADLQRLAEMRGRDPSWEEEVIWERDSAGRLRNLRPTFEEVRDFLEDAAGQLVAVDVETSGEHPLDCKLLCVGLAAEDGSAICVPFLEPGGGEYWTQNERARMTRMLADFFAGRFGGRPPRLVFHNGAFDSVVLWAYQMPVFATWTEDTMQMWHVLDSELPMGLDYIASRFTEIAYYKDAVKGDVRWLDLDWETLRSYNLRDVLCTVRAFAPLSAMLAERPPRQTELYLKDLAICREMAMATIRGIYVDQSRKYVLSRHLKAQETEHLGILQSIVGGVGLFKPGSPTHLRWALFEKLGFPIVKYTDKGNPSTDKEAMVLLALQAQSREQVQFLQSLVTWRKAAKLKSTFVGEWYGDPWEGEMAPTLEWDGTQAKDKKGNLLTEWRVTKMGQGEWVGGIPILGDGRAHPAWKHLTKSGRLASSPNAQNWTTAIKKIFCAPPGRVLVGADLNQAELRGMAYCANETDLLLAYQKNLNVHTINCTLLFRIRNPGQDTNEATEAFLADAVPRLLGLNYYDFPVAKESQWKGQRTLAKNFRFGWQYGAEAETLYQVIRSKRDPDTDQLLFPNIQLNEIEACKIMTEQTNPAVPRFWREITREITSLGYHECPLSGRRRYFKAGFKRNEMLNIRIQTLVASHMNDATLRIAPRLPAGAGIIMQVHDMLGAEADAKDAQDVVGVFKDELSKSFPLPGHPEAILPPDKPAIGRYVNQI